MKGIVFTEFLEMVESKFGYSVVDQILDASDLPSEGIYTAVGTYDHAEIIQLLSNLSSEVDLPPAVLLKEFGSYLFNAFLKNYPIFFSEVNNVVDFLKSIDGHIHVEVQKLYPEAALPTFDYELDENRSITLIYRSERKMSALAEGLIEKSIEHFGEPYQVSSELLKEDGSVVRFFIAKV